MAHRTRSALTLGLGLGLSACGGTIDPEVLAVADDHQLSIDQAVELLAAQSQLPNQPDVIEVVADLWIDYTLLAQAALEDSLLDSIDMSPLVRRQMEQEMVYRLRDEAVQVDTVVSDEDLETLWTQSGPDGEVSARHILLGIPEGASEAQRDSVRTLAASLKARAEGGEDFGELARLYSSDRGTAELGGDLGTFSRGDMLPPFEAAAFSLEPGQISDPVETIYGIHVIRVDSSDIATLEDGVVRTTFLAQVRAARTAAAESVYVADVEAAANVEVNGDVLGAMREIARRPGQRLSGRAADRALSDYEGGSYTVGEFQEFTQSQSPAFRVQVRNADSTALDGLVRSLTRSELLVNAAADAGHSLDETQMDSLRANARGQMRLAASQLGLVGITPSEGQSTEEAVEQRVHDNLTRILQGQRDVIPLGAIAYTLRQRYHAEVFPSAVEEAVVRLGSAPRPGPAPAPAPNAPPPAIPDSSGAGNP